MKFIVPKDYVLMVHMTYIQAVVGRGGSRGTTKIGFMYMLREQRNVLPPPVELQACVPSGRGRPTFPSRCRPPSPVTPVVYVI